MNFAGTDSIAINECANDYNKTGIKEYSNDLFDIVIPVIIDLLKEPMDIEEIALRLNINKNQASIWLNRAVSTGLVNKFSKPVRYIASSKITGNISLI